MLQCSRRCAEQRLSQKTHIAACAVESTTEIRGFHHAKYYEGDSDGFGLGDSKVDNNSLHEFDGYKHTDYPVHGLRFYLVQL